MSREQRRKASREQRKKRTDQIVPGAIILHQAPAALGSTLTALILSGLGHAYSLAASLPGEPNGQWPVWPIHVVIEVDGRRACGTIAPGERSISIEPPPLEN